MSSKAIVARLHLAAPIGHSRFLGIQTYRAALDVAGIGFEIETVESSAENRGFEPKKPFLT